MRFVDNSAKTARDLRDVGYTGVGEGSKDIVVNINVERDDGLGVGATNIGLPSFQIALGFTKGSSPAEAQSFADEVIKRLEAHWRVERLPANSGVMPDKNCI